MGEACPFDNCGTTSCSDFLGSIDDATLAMLQSAAALCPSEYANGFRMMLQYPNFVSHANACGFSSVCWALFFALLFCLFSICAEHLCA